MKAPLSIQLALLLLVLPALSSAEAETIQATSSPASSPASQPLIPQPPTLEENLQLTSFSISPQKIQLGDAAVFSLSVKSIGNSVSSYNATVRIYSSSGTAQPGIGFIHANIAGGEEQKLSKQWSSDGTPPGNYSAVANVTEENGQSAVLISNFEIAGAQQAAPGGAGQQPGAKPSPAECGSPADCAEFSGCDGNYTVLRCPYSSCPEKELFMVKSCAPAPPIGAEYEKQLCKDYTYLCTSSKPDQSPLYFCLPSALLAVLLSVYAIWQGTGRRWH